MTVFQPARQTLVSGPVDASLRLAGLSEAVGWPIGASGETYALSIRRDRIFLVNGPVLEDGWNSEMGLAVSDVTDGYLSCTITGHSAIAVLKRGTEIDLAIPSASVSRSFAGYPVFLYATGGSDSFRLHTSRALFDALWDLLGTFCAAASQA